MQPHKEDVYYYYQAYEDSLTEEGRGEHPIIRCRVCYLYAPAYSKNSAICEMCFDSDFWDFSTDKEF